MRLCFTVVLLLWGAVWVRGPLASGASFGPGADTTARVVSPAREPRYTPTPQPGLSRPLAPGESYKAPPVAAIPALAVIAPERQLAAVRIGYCESGWDATAHIIDVDGLPRAGAFMVGARWWGPVGPTLTEQAAQLESIAQRYGLAPWTTRDGCERWEAR